MSSTLPGKVGYSDSAPLQGFFEYEDKNTYLLNLMRCNLKQVIQIDAQRLPRPDQHGPQAVPDLGMLHARL